MATILYISDLHFGKELKGPHKKKLQDDVVASELADRLHKYVQRHGEMPKIDGVVVAGDIADAAEGGEFESAEIFLKRLLDILSLDKDRLLIVPGNHDINWKAEHMRSGSKRYYNFKESYQKIKGEAWNENTPTYIQIPMPRGKHAIVFGFNSCHVENSRWRGLGLIDEKQFDKVEQMLRDNGAENYPLRLAVLHHHVLPVHNYAPYVADVDLPDGIDTLKKDGRPYVSILLNSSKLIAVCHKNKIAAIFHGHSHVPYMATQTKYYHPYIDHTYDDNATTAIIGTGSLTSPSDVEPSFNHFQVVHFDCIGEKNIHAKIWPFITKLTEDIFDDATSDKTVLIPLNVEGNATSNIMKWSLAKDLNKQYDKILSKGFTDATYDRILEATVDWLNSVSNSTYGCATINTFIPRAKIYRVVAKWDYPETAKNVVYDLDGKSINATCARMNATVNIGERNKCEYASHEFDHIYSAPVGGQDQSCLAIPINGRGDDYPYAVINFARRRYYPSHEYSSKEVSLVYDILDLLEDALRKVELAMKAHRRGQVLELLYQLHYLIREKHDEDVCAQFQEIARNIYSYLGLSENFREAIGIFLPNPENIDRTICLGHVGFGENTLQNMQYNVNDCTSDDGLTGGVIYYRQSDYCIDHLNVKSRSAQGRKSSHKCTKDRAPVTTHLLSFVGVPIGEGNERHNKGALTLNIATPIQFKDDAWIEKEYIKPLTIVASLFDPIIEGPWKSHFRSVQATKIEKIDTQNVTKKNFRGRLKAKSQTLAEVRSTKKSTEAVSIPTSDNITAKE